MNVLVIGTGAIGAFYGSLLAKAGMRVSVQARANYETVRSSGIKVTSDTGLGSWHFNPAAVYRHGQEIREKPDVVLLCVKLTPGIDRVGLLRENLGPDTRIVLLSNGVEIEEEIAAAFPDHELISGLAFICVTRTAPGTIWHQAYGHLALGNYPTGLTQTARDLSAAFERAGIRCEITEDIVSARWRKCVWNAAFNPLSVLSGGLSTANILNSQEALVRGLMAEVCVLADALGHSLPADTVDQQIASTRSMPPYKTSMLLDFEAGRPMETEAILGHAVMAARRVGFAVPRLEMIYGLMRLRELALQNT